MTNQSPARPGRSDCPDRRSERETEGIRVHWGSLHNTLPLLSDTRINRGCMHHIYIIYPKTASESEVNKNGDSWLRSSINWGHFREGMTSMSMNRTRDSPFRESEWDRRLDDMLEDLGGGQGPAQGVLARPGGGQVVSGQQYSSSSMQQSYSYSSSSSSQQQNQVNGSQTWAKVLNPECDVWTTVISRTNERIWMNEFVKKVLTQKFKILNPVKLQTKLIVRVFLALIIFY